MLATLKKLGALLKYEFKFYFRVLPFLYAALVALAVFTGVKTLLAQRAGSYDGVDNKLFFMLIVLFIAILTVTVVLIIQRFRENFLGDPGYLMFTLPLTMPVLLVSKMLAAFCITALTLASAGISGLLLALLRTSAGQDSVADFMSGVVSWVTTFSGYQDRPTAAVAVLFVFNFFYGISLVYLVMTASRLLPRLRTPAAFVAYCVLGGISNRVLYALQAGSSLAFTLSIAVSLAFAALYFTVTSLLLKRTLNLE